MSNEHKERRLFDNKLHEALVAHIADEDLRLYELAERVSHIEGKIGTLENGLHINTTLTQQIADDTLTIREVMREAVGAVQLLCRLSKLFKFTVRYIVIPVCCVILAPWLMWYWFAHDYTLPVWMQKLYEVWK